MNKTSVNNINVTMIPWTAAWPFTIAFAHVTGWHILWSLFLWPYYLGDVIAGLAGVR